LTTLTKAAQIVAGCALCLCVFSCSPTDQTSKSTGAWEEIPTHYAKRFRIERSDSAYRVLVNIPTGDSSITYTYVFGTKAGTSGIMAVPLRKAALLSASHLGFAELLGVTQAIAAVQDTAWIYSAVVRHQAAAGTTTQVALGGTLDAERLASLRPDVVMVSAAGSAEADQQKKLTAAGLTVMLNADWLEAHPLGRAEWIKVFGVIFDNQRQADSIFAVVERNYLALAAQVQPTEPVAVVGGRSWRGTWYVPGGNSYVARLLKDAGAIYPWASDSTTGSIPLTAELVWQQSKSATVWLNPDEFRSRAAMLKEDARYAKFDAFKAGRIWNKTRRHTAAGGNDYWELGVARPDWLLADLVAILHPELLPNHTYTFYEQLGP
jgi:iron complex transport system substrate-binding protein